MKKAFLIIAVLIFPFFAAYSQNNDDVYYSGDDQNQQDPNQYNQNNYDNQGDANAPTYQTFYDQLSPYGSWVNYPGTGYVWVPNNMDPDFSPYLTGGHWVYTGYGWTWVSDYEWGWGPFHYGRWFRDDSYGWMWMPGYDWAPAWVVWGDYGGYYCWAPIGPREYLGPHYRPDPHRWYFVPHDRMAEGNVRVYVADHNTVFHGDYAGINERITVVNHANTYNQSVFYAGPKPNEVEKYVGHPVERVSVTNVNKPQASHVSGGQLNIYRPNIVRSAAPNQHAAPGKVVRPEELHGNTPVQRQSPAEQRTVTPQRSEPVQQQHQDWTPPRQSTPRQVVPEQQRAEPQRPQQQQRSEPQRPVDRGFVPQQKPAPMQQQHYSQPSQPRPSFSAPRGGGGGAPRGGGRH